MSGEIPNKDIIVRPSTRDDVGILGHDPCTGISDGNHCRINHSLITVSKEIQCVRDLKPGAAFLNKEHTDSLLPHVLSST